MGCILEIRDLHPLDYDLLVDVPVIDQDVGRLDV
jgi:hypothetical protein